jgi:hypothetical protein
MTGQTVDGARIEAAVMTIVEGIAQP